MTQHSEHWMKNTTKNSEHIKLLHDKTTSFHLIPKSPHSGERDTMEWGTQLCLGSRKPKFHREYYHSW